MSSSNRIYTEQLDQESLFRSQQLGQYPSIFFLLVENQHIFRDPSLTGIDSICCHWSQPKTINTRRKSQKPVLESRCRVRYPVQLSSVTPYCASFLSQKFFRDRFSPMWFECGCALNNLIILSIWQKTVIFQCFSVYWLWQKMKHNHCTWIQIWKQKFDSLNWANT